MKRKEILLLLMIISISASAQHYYCDKERLATKLREGLTTDLKHRNDERQLLNTIQILKNDTAQYWTDGRFVLTTMYNPYYLDPEYNPENRGIIEVGCERYWQLDPEAAIIGIHDFDIVGETVKEQGESALTVTVEKLGQYTMLVYRNALGVPVRAFYHIDNESANDRSWTCFFHYVLDGNYMLANGENAVFGFMQDFYEGKKYNSDPGIYLYQINPNNNLIDIMYGEGRVNHGDPSNPRYGKMPGGGGAGAIMGPMIWQLKLTKEGLEAKAIKDEQFVDHRPRLEKGDNVLTKVQCPWEGVDGKWAFASVIPLTHEMVKIFPKDVLELMYAEIFARHGKTFKVAKFQKYFNAQKWYKKSKSPTELTDIEKFNADLINEVILTTISF